MHTVAAKRMRFQKFRKARYATNVMFHHGARPGGSMEKRKLFSYDKNSLYGFEREVLLLPNGLEIRFTKQNQGSIRAF